METLYRHFNSNGVLLYVGISRYYKTRTDAHKRTSKWYQDVRKSVTEYYETRYEVLAAEKKAIKNESPLHNIIHNKFIQYRHYECDGEYQSKIREWAISTNDLSFDNFVASM